MTKTIKAALLDKSAYDIAVGDFFNDGGFSGTVIRVTKNAIAVEVANGRWTGSWNDRHKTIWIPRSIITVYRAIRGDYNGILESADKTYFETTMPDWWYRKNI